MAALMTSVILWAGLPALFVVPWVFDKIGLRKPFICGSFILLALASLITIFTSPSLSWFVVVALGIAPGVQFAMILVLPVELVTAEGVGRASGMIVSTGYIGGLMRTWITGYIMDLTRTLNLDLAVLIGLAIAGAYFVIRLPETPPELDCGSINSWHSQTEISGPKMLLNNYN